MVSPMRLQPPGQKALRTATIDSKGVVKVPNDHPMLQRIADLENTAARLAAIKAEITGIFNAAGVESREQLNTRRNQAEADL